MTSWNLLLSLSFVGCAVADVTPTRDERPTLAHTSKETLAPPRVIPTTTWAPAPIHLAAVRPTPQAEGPCPTDMVLAGRVCVDRYEAHLTALDAHGLTRVHPHVERPASGVRYVAANAKGVFPQGYISRIEATAACEAADKRLCSRGEWMTACRGTPATSCNRAKPHLLPEMFPERNWVFHYDEHFNSPLLNQVPDFLARTGDYDTCTSESGAHDLVGNLHEWVSDPVTRRFAESFAEEMPRQWQPVQSGNGIFMGGFYSTQNEHGAGCAFTTVAHEPAYHDYSTGFRCCRDSRP